MLPPRKMGPSRDTTRLALGLALLFFGAPTLAGTFTTGAATVSAKTTVNSNCTISTTAIAFGSYDPIGTNAAGGSALNAPGSISLTCLKNSSPTIELGNGSYFSSTRRLKDARSGDFLSYETYQPSAATPGAACSYSGTIWGRTGTHGMTFTPSATWSASSTFSFNVCGSVPAGQNPSVGTGYQDTIVATVNF
jgi:spore coat protein U-like protein